MRTQAACAMVTLAAMCATRSSPAVVIVVLAIVGLLALAALAAEQLRVERRCRSARTVSIHGEIVHRVPGAGAVTAGPHAARSGRTLPRCVGEPSGERWPPRC